MAYNVSTNKPKFSVAIQSEGYQKLINNTLGDKEIARKFVADISGVVSNNAMLSNCDAGSILSAGLTAQSLNLPLSPTLGFAYVVPYGGKAQFQIGWKGLVQLAERSGQYQSIGCYEVREGEIDGIDPLTREPKLLAPTPETLNNKIVGYCAYFKLVNGFTKVLYWTVEQCQAHARKYSKSYGTGKSTDNWTNMFDTMALKTVLKQLLSKWGVMSVELQQAVKFDQAVIDKENDTVDYIDGGASEAEDETFGLNINEDKNGVISE